MLISYETYMPFSSQSLEKQCNKLNFNVAIEGGSSDLSSTMTFTVQRSPLWCPPGGHGNAASQITLQRIDGLAA